MLIFSLFSTFEFECLIKNFGHMNSQLLKSAKFYKIHFYLQLYLLIHTLYLKRQSTTI